MTLNERLSAENRHLIILKTICEIEAGDISRFFKSILHIPDI